MTLLVPGLLGPWAGPGVEEALAGLGLPALGRLLSRTDPAGGILDDEPEGMTFGAFGYPRPAGGAWPVAAATYRLDTGADAPGIVMRADPVHLEPDLRTAHLVDDEGPALSREEADGLVAAVNEALAPDGLRIEAPHPRRWYVPLESAPRLASCPPSRAAGGDVRELLPAGDDGTRWRSILTTVQTVLHASPVNERREAAGALTVNSVWFWGAGSAVGPPPVAWDRVWSDDPLARALAEAGGVAGGAPPAGAREWLAQAAGKGRHLVVLDGGYRRARRRDVESWRDVLAGLEADWFAPLAGALGEFTVSEVVLLADPAGPRRADRAALRRWWRRRREFHTFVRGG